MHDSAFKGAVTYKTFRERERLRKSQLRSKIRNRIFLLIALISNTIMIRRNMKNNVEAEYFHHFHIRHEPRLWRQNRRLRKHFIPNFILNDLFKQINLNSQHCKINNINNKLLWFHKVFYSIDQTEDLYWLLLTSKTLMNN